MNQYSEPHQPQAIVTELPRHNNETDICRADFTAGDTVFSAVVTENSRCGFTFSNLDGFRDGLRFLTAKGWTRQPCLGIVLTDGDLLDCELADCFELDQTNIEAFLNALENWGDEEKAKVIIAMTDNIVDFRIDRDTPDSTRIAFAEYDNFQDLAEDHVEQGLIPGLSTETAPTHIDWDAVIRDLSQNYFEATIAGRCVIYRDD